MPKDCVTVTVTVTVCDCRLMWVSCGQYTLSMPGLFRGQHEEFCIFSSQKTNPGLVNMAWIFEENSSGRITFSQFVNLSQLIAVTSLKMREVCHHKWMDLKINSSRAGQQHWGQSATILSDSRGLLSHINRVFEPWHSVLLRQNLCVYFWSCAVAAPHEEVSIKKYGFSTANMFITHTQDSQVFTRMHVNASIILMLHEFLQRCQLIIQAHRAVMVKDSAPSPRFIWSSSWISKRFKQPNDFSFTVPRLLEPCCYSHKLKVASLFTIF